MVKIYQSYGFTKCVDQYISSSSNILYHNGYLLSGVNQYLTIISPKTGHIIRQLVHENSAKKASVRSIYAWGQRIFVGYDDGTLLCFLIIDDDFNYEIQISMDSHSSSINIITSMMNLQSQTNITQLLTSGNDGTIIIYDLISQEEQIIKNAHKGNIGGMSTISLFIEGMMIDCLVTVGKDGYLRVWNLQNLMLLGVVGIDGQGISLYLDTDRKIAYVGTNTEQIYVIKLGEEINPIFDSKKEQGANIKQIDNKQLNLKQVCWNVGIIKRNNHSRCLQISIDLNGIYILNSDKAIECYERLTDSQIIRRKKKIVSSKKQKQVTDELRKNSTDEIDQKAQQNEINLYQLTFKFKSEKKLLNRVYNFTIHKQNIYLNIGNNIHTLKREGQFNIVEEKQLTHSIGKTKQLNCSYPFTIYSSQTQCVIHSSSSLFSAKDTPIERLFSIKKQTDIKWCSLFNDGFIMIVYNDTLTIYDLAKNQEVYNQQNVQWEGCWVRANNCLLWKENKLALYQIGLNKSKQIQMKLISQYRSQEKINQASYLNQSTQKYLVNLQNSTMQFNYTDTHRSFLTMRGHKLPIFSYTVSTDDNWMVTGSLDKDIRLWDLQFGYCVKHLFAHKAPVTVVRYVKDTHYLFSGGRDGLVKMWDMDTYQLIFQLEEMLGEIRDISISNNGEYLIAGGVDGGFRVWERSSEQVVAGEYEEKNQEKIMIEDYTVNKIQKNQKEGDVGQLNKIRYQDLKYGQQIIEALQNNEHPTILAQLLKAIAPGNLGSSLSFLHKKHKVILQKYLCLMIRESYEIQLCFRTLQAVNSKAKNILNQKKNTSQGQSDSKLSNLLRESWKEQIKILRVNRQMLKLLGTSIKEQKQFI